MAPEWRKLAKMLDKIPDVHVGQVIDLSEYQIFVNQSRLTHLHQVDCEANSDLCHRFGIRGYPTIRMYPLNSKGFNKYIPYNQVSTNQSEHYQHQRYFSITEMCPVSIPGSRPIFPAMLRTSHPMGLSTRSWVRTLLGWCCSWLHGVITAQGKY